MTKPLALCCSENLLLANQLVNRLQDLGYRVQVTNDPQTLVAISVQEKPFVVIADLGYRTTDVCRVITELRGNEATKHIPVLAVGPTTDASLQATAREAGASLVVVESGLLQQLPDLLNYVFDIQ